MAEVILTLNIPEESYSRNLSYELNLISVFIKHNTILCFHLMYVFVTDILIKLRNISFR
jgi:hypothetical protein